MSPTGSDTKSFQVIDAVSSMEGTPVTARRRRSESFKDELVAKALEPDADVSAIARRAGVQPARLLAWRRKAMREGTVRAVGRHFVEVEVTGTEVIEIVIGGIAGTHPAWAAEGR